MKKGKISEQLPTSTSNVLDQWMTELTDDYVEVSRLAEAMRYQLSAAIPYESIIRVTIQGIDERPMSPYRPISEYVLGRITGVADGYQQLMQRIDAMNAAIEGAISIIRARIELLLEQQNLTLLVSMDQTTKRQAILQRTVESLSFYCDLVLRHQSGQLYLRSIPIHRMDWRRNPRHWTVCSSRSSLFSRPDGAGSQRNEQSAAFKWEEVTAPLSTAHMLGFLPSSLRTSNASGIADSPHDPGIKQPRAGGNRVITC